MYLVTNKNHKNSEPELYPSFLIQPLLTKAKKDSSIYVKPIGTALELQTQDLWLIIQPCDKFPSELE